LLRIDEEAPIKDQKNALLEQRVSNLEKENDLLKQQSTIQEKLTELAKREAEVYKVAFEKEKELTDRALKLAEVGKPKSNLELQGLLGLAAFVLRVLARKQFILEEIYHFG
jgi:Ser/Thr protein kinase RdoA (MazF antagonist)